MSDVRYGERGPAAQGALGLNESNGTIQLLDRLGHGIVGSAFSGGDGMHSSEDSTSAGITPTNGRTTRLIGGERCAKEGQAKQRSTLPSSNEENIAALGRIRALITSKMSLASCRTGRVTGAPEAAPTCQDLSQPDAGAVFKGVHILLEQNMRTAPGGDKVAYECLSVLQDAISWLAATCGGQEARGTAIPTTRDPTRLQGYNDALGAARMCVEPVIPAVIECLANASLRNPAQDVLVALSAEEDRLPSTRSMLVDHLARHGLEHDNMVVRLRSALVTPDLLARGLILNERQYRRVLEALIGRLRDVEVDVVEAAVTALTTLHRRDSERLRLSEKHLDHAHRRLLRHHGKRIFVAGEDAPVADSDTGEGAGTGTATEARKSPSLSSSSDSADAAAGRPQFEPLVDGVIVADRSEGSLRSGPSSIRNSAATPDETILMSGRLEAVVDYPVVRGNNELRAIDGGGRLESNGPCDGRVVAPPLMSLADTGLDPTSAAAGRCKKTSLASKQRHVTAAQVASVGAEHHDLRRSCHGGTFPLAKLLSILTNVRGGGGANAGLARGIDSGFRGPSHLPSARYPAEASTAGTRRLERVRAMDDAKRLVLADNGVVPASVDRCMEELLTVTLNIADDPDSKIALLALQILHALALRMGQRLQPYLALLSSALVTKLGDHKVAARHHAMVVLSALVRAVGLAGLAPQLIQSGFPSAAWRSREGSLRLVIAGLWTGASISDPLTAKETTRNLRGTGEFNRKVDEAGLVREIGSLLADECPEVQFAAVEALAVAVHVWAATEADVVQVLDDADLLRSDDTRKRLSARLRDPPSTLPRFGPTQVDLDAGLASWRSPERATRRRRASASAPEPEAGGAGSLKYQEGHEASSITAPRTGDTGGGAAGAACTIGDDDREQRHSSTRAIKDAGLEDYVDREGTRTDGSAGGTCALRCWRSDGAGELREVSPWQQRRVRREARHTSGESDADYEGSTRERRRRRAGGATHEGPEDSRGQVGSHRRASSPDVASRSAASSGHGYVPSWAAGDKEGGNHARCELGSPAMQQQTRPEHEERYCSRIEEHTGSSLGPGSPPEKMLEGAGCVEQRTGHWDHSGGRKPSTEVGVFDRTDPTTAVNVALLSTLKRGGPRNARANRRAVSAAAGGGGDPLSTAVETGGGSAASSALPGGCSRPRRGVPTEPTTPVPVGRYDNAGRRRQMETTIQQPLPLTRAATESTRRARKDNDLEAAAEAVIAADMDGCRSEASSSEFTSPVGCAQWMEQDETGGEDMGDSGHRQARNGDTKKWGKNSGAICRPSGEASTPSLRGPGRAKPARMSPSQRGPAHKQNSFDYLTLEDIRPSPNPGQELQRATLSLPRADWPDIFHTLNSVRRLAVHHADLLGSHPHLHALVRDVLGQVDNLRSQVAKNSLLTLADLWRGLGESLDPELPMVCPVVVKKMADKVEFLVEAARECVNEIVATSTQGRALSAFLASGSHRNPAVRAKTALAMLLCIRRRCIGGDAGTTSGSAHREGVDASAMRRGRSNTNPRDMDRVLSMLPRFLQDGNQETRLHAKRIVAFLLDVGEVDEDRLRRDIPPPILERLQRDLLLSSSPASLGPVTATTRASAGNGGTPRGFPQGFFAGSTTGSEGSSRLIDTMNMAPSPSSCSSVGGSGNASDIRNRRRGRRGECAEGWGCREGWTTGALQAVQAEEDAIEGDDAFVISHRNRRSRLWAEEHSSLSSDRDHEDQSIRRRRKGLNHNRQPAASFASSNRGSEEDQARHTGAQDNRKVTGEPRKGSRRESEAPKATSRSRGCLSRDVELLPGLYKRLDSGDWRDRMSGLNDVVSLLERRGDEMHAAGKSARLVDRVAELLSDGNLKVNLLALDSVVRVSSTMGDKLDSMVNTLVPAVCKNLASSNYQRVGMAEEALDAICGAVDPCLVVQPVASLAQYGNARLKVPMLDLLRELTPVVGATKPLLLTKYIRPAALALVRANHRSVRDAGISLLRAVEVALDPSHVQADEAWTQGKRHRLGK